MANYKLRFFTKGRRSVSVDEKLRNRFYFSEIPTNPEYNSSETPDSRFTCKFYQKPISAGLVQSDTIVMLGESNGEVGPIPSFTNYISPIVSNWKLFLFIDTLDQTDLRFFTVDKENDEVKWTDRILITFPNRSDYESEEDYNKAIAETCAFHIGFCGDKEGQYENKIHFCEIRTVETDPANLTGVEEIELIGSMTVYSSAIGEDERYRSLFTNFGIPDPISYMNVFKDQTDTEKKISMYDSHIDYDRLNKKSKELFLSYDRIFPYVGTYKALINAVDFLGYEDIYFKEWFKEISDTTGKKPNLVSYNIKYKSGQKGNMLSDLPVERRIALKKLNWLSMIYRISEEIRNSEGDIEYDVLPDNVCMPRIKENYTAYEATEILAKLVGLKDWLEKNIIALNCRIIEISGEGITFERYKHKIYGKYDTGLDYVSEASVSPFLYDSDGIIPITSNGAEIEVGLKELSDQEFVRTHNDFIIKCMMSARYGVLGNSTYGMGSFDITDIPILLQDNKLFFDPKLIVKNFLGKDDNEDGFTSHFTNLPSIQIENARLRNPNKQWSESIEYIIRPSSVAGASYELVNLVDPMRPVYRKKDYITLCPAYKKSDVTRAIDPKPTLSYSTNNKLGVPLFMIQNFQDISFRKFNDENGVTEYTDPIDKTKEYILEILDGKMVFTNTYTDKYGETISRTMYLNFHFDTDSNEQSIELNYVYEKVVKISNIKDAGGPTHATISVKNAGDYIVYAYVCDEYNSIYCARCPNVASVIAQTPNIIMLSTNESSNNSSDFFDKNVTHEQSDYIKYGEYKRDNRDRLMDDYKNGGSNYMCTLKEQYLSNDIEVVSGPEGREIVKHVEYPTISYAIDNPETGDIANFMNLTDKFRCVETYKINQYEMYIWLERTGNYESNTIIYNTQPANFVIYDNIHAIPVFQKYVTVQYGTVPGFEHLKNYPYIKISPDGTLDDTALYIGAGETQPNKKATYKELAQLKYVAVSRNAVGNDVGTSDIVQIMRDKKLYTLYLQAVYEVPCVSLSKNEDDNSISLELDTTEFSDAPNQLFYKDQIIKLGIIKTIVSPKTTVKNEIQSWTSMKITDIANSVIKTNGLYSSVVAKLVNEHKENVRCVVTHAHQAFVNYTVPVTDAYESMTKSGGITTHLFVEDDHILDYLDNTFSVSSRKFNVENAYDMWTNNILDNTGASTMYPETCLDTHESPRWGTAYENAQLYKYTSPITIKLGEHIILTWERQTVINTEQHAFWKVSVYDKETDSFKLLFESWDDSLFMTPSEPGIYSVEVSVYDYCGNISSSELVGAFKVIE